MRVSNSRAVIFSILFGVSLVLPGSSGAEETRQASDWIPQEPGDTVRSGGYDSDTDWSRFRRIMVHPIDVAYTTKFKQAHPDDPPSELSAEDLDRVRNYFQRAFEKQVARNYPITTDPSPDVLRVDAVLVDPVLDKSWWLRPGDSIYRGETRVSLVVVLRDSETGAVLHQVKLPLRIGSLGFEDSALNYWGYIRLVFDRVAMRVRWTLDDAPRLTDS
jgi:hypothetical protein